MKGMIIVEALYNKIQEYLNMDEEISFEEFDDFYKQVVSELSERHEQLDEEDLWKALYVVENIMSNADSRANSLKGAVSKKYRKMAERTQLWSKNFMGRLRALGYTEEQINERFDKMYEELPASSES